MIQLAGQFVPVKLNAEKDGQAAAKKYKVQGYPTILFVNGAGEVEGTIGGYMPPESFAPELTRIGTAHKEFPQLVDRMKSNPNHAKTAGKLAAAYAGRGSIEKAEEMLAIAEKDPTAAGPSLAVALNGVADYYQNSGKFDKAIPLFQKAGKVGQTPHDIAYALISEATCYFQSNRRKEAVKPLEALLELKDAPKEWVTQGKSMLEQAKSAR